MLRRKIFPKSSWSVRATCDAGGIGSSSALSALRRPMIDFLRGDRQLLPADGVVLPLLEQQDRAALAGLAGRDERDVGRLDQRRVLGAVDEAGEVQIVVVRPADDLVGEPSRTARRAR